jgi:hypothetical protein
MLAATGVGQPAVKTFMRAFQLEYSAESWAAARRPPGMPPTP